MFNRIQAKQLQKTHVVDISSQICRWFHTTILSIYILMVLHNT